MSARPHKAERPVPDGPAAVPGEIDRQIRELAYGYFVERGRADGHELDDWLRAEAQVQKLNGSAALRGRATAS